MSKTTALLSLLLLAACADATPADAPPDPEFGNEYSMGRADGLLPDEGSAAARAILDFVNAPVGDQADADALFRTLSAVIHHVAAQNIVAMRLGADQVAGSADDLLFTSLAQLDQVPFVGRAALGALHQHIGQTQTEVDCSRVVGAVVSTRDQLRAIEHSGCTTFSGDVEIDVRTAVPAAEHGMTALSRVRSAQGRFVITAFPSYIHLPNLETVGGELRLEGYAPFSAPELASVGRLIAGPSVSAPKLSTAGYVALPCSRVHDLSGLSTVGEFHVNGGAQCELLDLPALTYVDELRFSGVEANIRMPALTRVGRLQAGSYDFSSTVLAIEVVERDMRLDHARGLNRRFDQLAWIGGDVLVKEPGDAHDFVAVQHVGGSVYVQFEGPMDGLQLFEGMVEHRRFISIQGKCDEHASINLFERLESASEIQGDVRDKTRQAVASAVPCNLVAFANLEEAGWIQWGALDARSFSRLDRARSLRASRLLPGALPSLTVVERLETYHGSVGAQQLVAVEDELSVGWITADAFPALETLGGNLRITDRGSLEFRSGYVQGFIDRLSYFGGELIFD